LRNGISALTGAAATVPDDAMIEDLANIGGAVSVLGADPIFIAAPPRAIEIQLRARRSPFPYTVLPSAAIAPADVLAVSPVGLASVLGTVPRIETKKAGTLHMEDTSPLQIASGSPGTVSSPTRDLWQTDCVSITITFDVDFCLRDSRACAWTTATAW
jgi:hypothetical protein